MQDAKEEVRARLNIEDVVGEYVQLKRAGRNFKGLSPFSGEKTASFFVSPDKHIWHDFSSNKGGDVFSFIMEMEGMDFRQALEHLARKAGVDMSMYQSKGGQETARKKKRLLEALDLAAQYYQQSLVKNQHAVTYVFRKRALTREVAQEFRIGYAPTSGDALVRFLRGRGFSADEIAEAGLTNRFGGDLFRGRMMVPLMDGSGQVIGFTARILPVDDAPADSNAPKYLNTPQTLLYDKSRHAFGLSQAKEAIRKSDYAVIVEGNLDVVSSHQVFIKQVVATAGTAMTEHHLRALSRLSGNIRLAFDGDKAGVAATERAIPIAQSVGVELTIISLPGEAKDPDELIQEDPALWQQAIDDAQPVVDWILRRYSEREDLTTAAGKRAFTTAALGVVSHLHDVVEQEHYLQEIAGYTNSSMEALKAKLFAAPTEAPRELRKPLHQPSSEQIEVDAYNYQDDVLAIGMTDPATHDLFRTLNPESLQGARRQAVATYLVGGRKTAVGELPADLQEYADYVTMLELTADARYAEWNDQDRYFQTARLLRQIATEHKKQQKDMLTDKLRDAETMGQDEEANQIRQQLNNLIKEIQRG